MKFMTVREFLRGGYKTISEPTVVSNHGTPVFTVMPAAGAPQPNGTERSKDVDWLKPRLKS